MRDVRELHEEWMERPGYRAEYEALEDEFALAASILRARIEAGLTQEELAARMGTKQEVVARWEGGRAVPSGRTLQRIATATGHRLRISFEPPAPIPQA